jgi:hypothetical protein
VLEQVAIIFVPLNVSTIFAPPFKLVIEAVTPSLTTKDELWNEVPLLPEKTVTINEPESPNTEKTVNGVAATKAMVLLTVLKVGAVTDAEATKAPNWLIFANKTPPFPQGVKSPVWLTTEST